MKRSYIAVFLVLAVCFGCGRTSTPPIGLVGTFRSERPVTNDGKPLVYYQFEFGENGLAAFSLVEANGRVTSGRQPRHRFSIEGKKITFRPEEFVGATPRGHPASASLPPTLLYASRDKLMFKDGGFVLYRID